jgi:hypothetical protein
MICRENENLGFAQEMQQVAIKIVSERKFQLVAGRIAARPHITDAFLHHADAELILRPGSVNGHQDREQRE